MSDKKKDSLFKLYIILCVGLSMISLFFHIKHGIYFSDHEWLWKECACVLKGIDPVEAIRQNMVFSDIGTMPPNTAALPWTKIIGIVIHGAFLPYQLSCIYYSILNLLVFIWMFYLVNKSLMKKYQDRQLALWGGINVLSSWYIVDWILVGNNAAIVCFLTVCAICLMDEHECVSGCLLGIAMIKPQIVVPFYFVWLFLKKWKAIAISAGIVIVSWLLSMMITGSPLFMQLNNLFGAALGLNEIYHVFGIFDSFRHIGVDTKVVMLMSMLFGITVCVCFSWYLLKKYEVESNMFLLYITPAVVSVFWCYKSQCDYNILMILAIAIVEIWYLSEKSWRVLVGLCVLEMVMLMKPFSAVNAVLAYAGVWNRNDMVYIVNRSDLYVKTAAFFGMMFVLLRSSGLRRENRNEK